MDLMADLHVGPILGYLLRRSEFDDVVGDRQEPVDLLVPSRPPICRHGLEAALLPEYGSCKFPHNEGDLCKW
jgi:hypothetical protein